MMPCVVNRLGLLVGEAFNVVGEFSVDPEAVWAVFCWWCYSHASCDFS